MKKEDVPQDAGPESEVRRLIWALDENGRYVTVPSIGWDPSNTGFIKYWDFLRGLIRDARRAVEQGEKSPLHYWMTVNILDERMLADYMGLWTWQVRRLIRPSVFARLSPAILERYAAIFRIQADELRRLPETDPRDLPSFPLPDFKA
ncbi:MAG: hypothetical protein WC378_03280 [Opitutaceae bacterium]|jgi:hypothetical protein